MELIADTGKSKVFKSGNKAYKFMLNIDDFEKDTRTYNAIKSNGISNIIHYDTIDRDIKMMEMEYYPYNLEKYLANSYDFEMNTEQINKILFILTKTLSSLHCRDIVHGDFKAKNIMLDKDLNPIVIDFDLSETETKESDIRKFHILIYQLLYKVEYKPSVYNNYKRIMNKIDNDHPLIGNAMKKDNILFILEVFWIFNKKKDTLNLSNHELIKKQVLKFIEKRKKNNDSQYSEDIPSLDRVDNIR